MQGESYPGRRAAQTPPGPASGNVAPPMPLLSVTSDRVDGIDRVAVSGELDISTAPRLEDELLRVERDEPGTLALDLRQLTFMDSTGLRIVVAADARARESGRRFVVVKGPDSVQRIFTLTRLDERLELIDDLPG
jgi:anti-sigma B factor antagonist